MIAAAAGDRWNGHERIHRRRGASAEAGLAADPDGSGPAAVVIGVTIVAHEVLAERLFETLVNGDRPAARAIVEETIRRGIPAETLTTDVFWPTYELVCKMYRADQMSRLSHHMATRLLRVLVDQTATRFTMRQKVGRSVFAVCGPNDADELGAQMAVDLLEASGFSMTFAGGGIAGDEILGTVQERQPDVLLMFASAPGDLPEIRGMIDQIHEIGACRGLQVVVGGGVFNRAEGLAEEIGADLWATTPAELAQAMHEEPARRAATDQRTVGRKRRIVRAEAA